MLFAQLSFVLMEHLSGLMGEVWLAINWRDWLSVWERGGQDGWMGGEMAGLVVVWLSG
jgi:hypothetical protein